MLHNVFWPRGWPARPDSPAESRQIVAERLAEAPALIPICAHRAIPNEPLEAGNPVFSIWQTDIIIYGDDLADYLWHEFDNDELDGQLVGRGAAGADDPILDGDAQFGRAAGRTVEDCRTRGTFPNAGPRDRAVPVPARKPGEILRGYRPPPPPLVANGG